MLYCLGANSLGNNDPQNSMILQHKEISYRFVNIHRLSIIHLDFRPDNILSKNSIAYIGDSSLKQKLEETYNWCIALRSS